MMDVNEAQMHWAQEADDEWRMDTFIATQVYFQFGRIKYIDRCNCLFDADNIIYRYETDAIDGHYDGGMILIKDHRDRVVWAFEFRFDGGAV